MKINWLKVGKVAGMVLSIGGSIIAGIVGDKELKNTVDKVVDEKLKSV